MTKTTTLDGVERYPVNGIKAIIVGGGNAGLNAALECWRKGCDVVVLEQGEAPSPLGDFFSIVPSALTTLVKYPRMYQKYHEKAYSCSTRLLLPNGKTVLSELPEWNREGVTHAAPDVKVTILNRRPDFTNMQLEQCKALNIPVYFGVQGLGVTETSQNVVVCTNKGDFTGDICISADGIGSKMPWPAPGGIAAVQDSGYAITRVSFPLKTFKAGSLAEQMATEALKERPQLRVYLGVNVHLIMCITPDYVAWMFTHEADKESKESWQSLRDPEVITNLIEKSSNDWDPAVLDFIRQTPSQVVDWRLMWRDSLEEWTSDGGRIVKIGDSAHAFLPTAGNGAGMALEDGLSLAECLHIGGKSDIQWATKVHNRLRFERVSILQQTGFSNREELHFSDLDAIGQDLEQARVGPFTIGRWVWGHNPETYATENYDACLECVKEGRHFDNKNLPPGHKFKSWTMEEEVTRMKEGRPSDLKKNGYWGM